MGLRWPNTNGAAGCFARTRARRRFMPVVDETLREEVGGKAAQLIELKRAGFRVPEFACAPPDLALAVAQLGFPLAVRSSASAEDGGDCSFAGQFRSFLNLE